MILLPGQNDAQQSIFPNDFSQLPPRWAGCMITMTKNGEAMMSAKSDGPIILVYRDSDLVFPASLGEISHWATPVQYSLTIEKQFKLTRSDLVVIISTSLQAVISETDLRGSLYGVEPESVPSLIAEMMKSLHLKSKEAIEIAVAVVI